MTDYAHSIGLTAGWYGNNCICSDKCQTDACYQGDVTATVNYGFDRYADGMGAPLCSSEGLLPKPTFFMPPRAFFAALSSTAVVPRRISTSSTPCSTRRGSRS